MVRQGELAAVQALLAEIMDMLWQQGERLRGLEYTMRNGERDAELRSFRRSKWWARRALQEDFQEKVRLYGLPGAARVALTEKSCPCGKGHRALDVYQYDKGEGRWKATAEGICPVELWVFRSAQIRKRSGFEAASQWYKEHPLEELLREALPDRY